ncbi:MAG: dihydrodipicolinate synthase family protein [Bacillus sp. (in: firmicutes)]
MKNPFIPFSVAMVTPFSSNGEIDLDGVTDLLNYYKNQEVPALLISGSTGEQHSMTIQERSDFFSAVKKSCKARNASLWRCSCCSNKGCRFTRSCC